MKKFREQIKLANLLLAALQELKKNKLRQIRTRLEDFSCKCSEVTKNSHIFYAARQKDGTVKGIYTGVQPRLVDMFDQVPNQWAPAIGGPNGNCGKDDDIEYITTLFFDIDVASKERGADYPASESELQNSFKAVQCLANQPELKNHATICCSGNGHYILAPIVPIQVYEKKVARQFKAFCQELADRIAGQLPNNVRIDPVYNPSRVMRVIGTVNKKGKSLVNRPYRRAYFITNPGRDRSYELYHRILNMEVISPKNTRPVTGGCIRCNLKKLQACEFLQWCRRYPEQVSEPQWFALITNLVRLEGGSNMIHEISRLDKHRYDFDTTEKAIQRILQNGYKPTNCKTLVKIHVNPAMRGQFKCSKIRNCPARSPMYLASHHAMYDIL